MSIKAIGLIETVGLAAAIEAADAASKAANITLLGYENSKGGGLIAVKLTGDVGAVKAAVAAGSAAAQRIGKVAATHIIPRPHAEIEPLIRSLTRGQQAPAAEEKPKPAAKPKTASAAPKRKTTRTAKKPAAKPKPATPAEPAQPEPPADTPPPAGDDTPPAE